MTFLFRGLSMVNYHSYFLLAENRREKRSGGKGGGGGEDGERRMERKIFLCFNLKYGVTTHQKVKKTSKILSIHPFFRNYHKPLHKSKYLKHFEQ